MGKPENSPPPRPSTVPAEARWDPRDPGFEWVVGGLDAEGRRHGPYRSWTRDGVLHGQCNYVHGKVHGKNINFHPDGTVASEADWVMGLILDSVFYRSDAPSPEPFPQAAPNVWSVRYCTRDGKTNYTIRYYTRDGTECGPDGNPLPPRPASVSPHARWFPDMDRWVDGEIERGTNRQVGRWRWWTRDGVLRHEEMRDPTGQPVLVAEYEADGTLKKKSTRSAQGVERELYFSDGKLSSRTREDASGRQTYRASWQPDGELREEIERTFELDVLTSVTERGAGGVLRFEARREGTALACVLYREDGRSIAATGMIEDDKLVGTWRLFDETGAVRRELDATPLAIAHRPTAHGLEHDLGRALYEHDLRTLPMPEQLAGVDDEPWAETSGWYDEHVEEIPQLLRGLVSPEPLVRSYCLGAIASEIEHQGSVSPATARVIPYLARLLSHPGVDRAQLLATIHDAGHSAAEYLSEIEDLEPDDLGRVAIEGTCQAIDAAWPHIFECFASASDDERRMIFALAHLAPAAQASLLDVARHSTVPALRAWAIATLTERDAFELEDVLPSLGDKDLLVRAATAIAIAERVRRDTPREAVAVLREAVHAYQDIATRFAELPYVEAHVLAHLALAAGAVRSPDARSLAQALCERLDHVDERSAVHYGRGLLLLAFGTGELPFAKRFVEILDTLARSAQFWVRDTTAAEVLARWNLPASQDALAQLVTELKSQREPEAWLHARMHRSE